MNTPTGCKLVIQSGPSVGHSFNLTPGETIIGRDPSADITINEQVISRRHACITARGDQFFLKDLGSSNGTYLNGHRITRETPLHPGDRITLGPDFALEFQAPISTSEATRILEEPVPASKGARPTLIVTVEGSTPSTYILEKPRLTIGRAPDNDIVIPSQVMSRYHAYLEQEGDAYVLVPLPNATNSFLLEGHPVTKRQPLAHRQELRIPSQIPNTSVSLLYHAPTQAARPVTPARPSRPDQTPHTLLDSDFEFDLQATPPELIVTVAGQPSRTFQLTKPRVTIGRAEDNDIVIPSPIISRHHGHLELKGNQYELVVNPKATNAFLYEGRPVERHVFRHEDQLRIASTLPGQMVTLTYHSPAQAVSTVDFSTISFGEKSALTFGRDPRNDVVISVPTVSQFHAQIEKIGQRYRVTDLNSSNGTFVNDVRIDKEAWITPGDTIRIGPYRFVTGQDEFAQYDETGGMKVEAIGLNKWVRKDLNILKNISLIFQPKEFIVVVGQSGGGKSTLLDAIAGYRPATHGRVTVNGIDVYKNFDAIRNEIGYVPQRDIIHMELTVYQALDYAARLRMPKDTTKEERHRRIMEVLEDLDLAHRKDVQISGLSGGQQKRVSIGVELLTKPGLFFLDEPTSGLDPGTETAFMHLMRRLADQGRTIVLVTHATKNVMLADKVVFLCRGGYLSWFGPPDEALEYFDAFRSERERRTRAMEFDQIYAILDDPNKGSPEQWAERYQASEAFQKYIVRPLQGVQITPSPAASPAAPVPPPQISRKANVSSLRQFLILSARNIKILTRDRSSLILMLIAAPLVAMLDLVIAPLMGSNPYDYYSGDANNASITLFLMTIYCLLVAGLSQMREFVKEADIYKRERLVNLRIVPYVASKVWVAILLAFYHAAAYAIVHYIAFEMPGGTTEFVQIYFTLVLAAMGGMICGLLASALAPAASSAPMIMILLLIPQIVLSGALAPVPSTISSIASTRWAFEGFIGITGIGSDVAADPCWALDEQTRDAMSLEDKEAQGCRCMGVAVFDPNSCNFPGIGQFHVPEIDQPPPPEPAPLREKPAEPVLPPKPTPPADQKDPMAMGKYLSELQKYQEEASLIQENFKSQMALYQAEVEIYQAEMAEYQEEYTKWNIARISAVGAAEGVIKGMKEQFGWAWVNKHDTQGYYSWLITTWVAQLIIVGVLIILILFLIKRKDVQ